MEGELMRKEKRKENTVWCFEVSRPLCDKTNIVVRIKKNSTIINAPFCPLVGVPAAALPPLVSMLPVLMLLVLELNLELNGRLLLKPLNVGALAPAEREAAES